MNNTNVPNYPGSIEIEEVLHNNGENTEDITKIVLLIDINSDVNISSSFCELTIADYKNFLEKRQFGPGDVISFTVKHSDISYERRYRIKSINDILNMENGRTYKLKLVSELEYMSIHTRISKAFSGLPSEIADVVLRQHTFERPDVWEPSVNNISYISPAISPIKVIDWLAKNSYTSEMNSRMVFFQDSKQFWNFTSISKLKSMYDGITTYRYNQNISSNENQIPNQEALIYEILSLRYPTNAFDIYKEMERGNIKNTFFTLDPTNKLLSVNNYDYWNHYSSKSVNNIMSWKEENLGSGNIVTSYATSYSTQLPEFRSMYDAYNEEFSIPQTQTIEITIRGNHVIDIGQIVNIEIPSQEPTGPEEEPRLDRMWSGKYYIISKRDQMDKNGHRIALRLVKDSFI